MRKWKEFRERKRKKRKRKKKEVERERVIKNGKKESERKR